MATTIIVKTSVTAVAEVVTQPAVILKSMAHSSFKRNRTVISDTVNDCNSCARAGDSSSGGGGGDSSSGGGGSDSSHSVRKLAAGQTAEKLR